MKVTAPHYKLQDVVKKLSGINKKLFWGILALSVTREVLKRYYDVKELTDVVAIASMTAIGLYFLIDIVNSFILTPKVEDIKSDDLIDNSFGSSFCATSSDGYFDNNDLPHGLYKASANLFEKSFFTYSLVKATVIKKVIVPFVMVSLLLVFAYFGFRETGFPVLPLMQALLSSTILGALIRHLVLLNRLSGIYDGWVMFFQQKDVEKTIGTLAPQVYRYWLQYEKLLSKMNPGIGEQDYKRLREKLNEQWKEHRSRYAIKCT